MVYKLASNDVWEMSAQEKVVEYTIGIGVELSSCERQSGVSEYICGGNPLSGAAVDDSRDAGKLKGECIV